MAADTFARRSPKDIRAENDLYINRPILLGFSLCQTEFIAIIHILMEYVIRILFSSTLLSPLYLSSVACSLACFLFVREFNCALEAKIPFTLNFRVDDINRMVQQVEYHLLSSRPFLLSIG